MFLKHFEASLLFNLAIRSQRWRDFYFGTYLVITYLWSVVQYR